MGVTLGTEPDRQFTVYDDDGCEIGFACIIPDRKPQGGAQIMYRLWPPHRGRGLGHELLGAVVTRAFAAGYTLLHLDLTTLARHEAAVYVAKAAGFHVEPHPCIEQYDPWPEQCLYLVLRSRYHLAMATGRERGAPTMPSELVVTDGTVHLRPVRPGRNARRHTFVVMNGSRSVGSAKLSLRRRRQGEVGVWINDGDQGQGVGSATLMALLDVAFGHMALERVTAAIKPDNVPALAAVRRAGFRPCAREVGMHASRVAFELCKPRR